jgi:hypothetical protein
VSVAQLKKDSEAGIELKLLTRWGQAVSDDNLPEILRGWRKVTESHKTHLYMGERQKKSCLDIPKASLVEYTGDTLTIYSAGYRRLTAAESALLKAWEDIKATPQYAEKAKADSGSAYYAELDFFGSHKATYLMGLSPVCGMVLDLNLYHSGIAECVRDDAVKGAVVLSYAVRKTAA